MYPEIDRKIGYAFKTDRGSICLKADEPIDPAKLGQLMSKGLYIQKRKRKAQAEYQSFADEYDSRETAHTVSNKNTSGKNNTRRTANAAYILKPPRP